MSDQADETEPRPLPAAERLPPEPPIKTGCDMADQGPDPERNQTRVAVITMEEYERLVCQTRDKEGSGEAPRNESA
jgi:hypothetical protein